MNNIPIISWSAIITNAKSTYVSEKYVCQWRDHSINHLNTFIITLSIYVYLHILCVYVVYAVNVIFYARTPSNTSARTSIWSGSRLQPSCPVSHLYFSYTILYDQIPFPSIPRFYFFIFFMYCTMYTMLCYVVPQSVCSVCICLLAQSSSAFCVFLFLFNRINTISKQLV
jgi:hypothetical protein